MGRKKIGFGNSDPDDEGCCEGSDAQIKQFIENSFDPIGITSNKEFKTSAELVYMLREFDNISLKVVNEIMNELNYKLIFIEGVPNWIVYLKGSDKYTD